MGRDELSRSSSPVKIEITVALQWAQQGDDYSTAEALFRRTQRPEH